MKSDCAQAGGGALDELMHLLGQLGLGTAAHPIYDMIMDLEVESLSMPELQDAIRHILSLHGYEACADAVVSALGEVGFAGLRAEGAGGEVSAAGACGKNSRRRTG
jgi:hypothetical protein